MNRFCFSCGTDGRSSKQFAIGTNIGKVTQTLMGASGSQRNNRATSYTGWQLTALEWPRLTPAYWGGAADRGRLCHCPASTCDPAIELQPLFPDGYPATYPKQTAVEVQSQIADESEMTPPFVAVGREPSGMWTPCGLSITTDYDEPDGSRRSAPV